MVAGAGGSSSAMPWKKWGLPAATLRMSASAVKHHLESIFSKLGVQDRTQAIHRVTCLTSADDQIFIAGAFEAKDVDIRRSGSFLRQHGGNAEKRSFDKAEGLRDELAGVGCLHPIQDSLDDGVDIDVRRLCCSDAALASGFLKSAIGENASQLGAHFSDESLFGG